MPPIRPTPRPPIYATEPEEPTPMPQSVCRTDGHCPMADRVSRIERTLDAHARDLGKGAVTMTRLEGNLNRFADSIDRLETVVEKLSAKSEAPKQANPYWQAVVLALIQWGVPLVALGLILSVIKSGVIHP